MSLLSTLQANPDATLLTLVAGILLLYLEANRPGSILPGCLGALLTLLSLNAFAHMSLRPSALAISTLGVALVFTELFRPARNLLATLGAALLTFGLRFLLQPFAPVHVHTPTAILAGVGLAAVTLWLARIALRARRNKRTLSSILSSPRDPRRIPAPHRID